MKQGEYGTAVRAPWGRYAVICLFPMAVVGFALLFRVVAGAGFYDSNFEAFYNVLTRDQGEGIVRAARAQLTVVIWLLILTNLLWMIGVGWTMWRWEKENE